MGVYSFATHFVLLLNPVAFSIALKFNSKTNYHQVAQYVIDGLVINFGELGFVSRICPHTQGVQLVKSGRSISSLG